MDTDIASLIGLPIFSCLPFHGESDYGRRRMCVKELFILAMGRLERGRKEEKKTEKHNRPNLKRV